MRTSGIFIDDTSRYVKDWTWFKVFPWMLMETGLGSLLITWTSVFPMLMVRPNCLLVVWTKLTRVWRSASDSAINAMSSAKRRLLTIDPFNLKSMLESSIAVVMTSSRRMLKSWGERMHSCLTPVSVWNQSIISLSTLTALLEIL